VPSFNHLTLVGNLTRDPEVRYVDGGGKAVCKFAIAINRKTKNADEVMYVDIVAWDRLGEICNQYLGKGDPVLISGRLSIRDYTNKDGEKRKAVECVASDMQMLGTKNRPGDSGSSDGSRSNAGGGSAGFAGGAAGGGNDGFDDAMDDEIPF
jgi:single-strand DNA-binding protein